MLAGDVIAAASLPNMFRAMNLESPEFNPPFWLSNPHIQTVMPQLFRRRPKLELRRQRVELPDGDFIDLAWPVRPRGPSILVLHGLGGSLNSHYAGPAMAALIEGGFNPVFMHLRGCSGEPNRLARSYHSGASEDLRWVLEHCQQIQQPIAGAVGFSLGGNILLKYLGETGAASLLSCAVAVSVPFRLASAGRRLEKGMSRIYQRYLLDKLKRAYSEKQQRLAPSLSVDLEAITSLRQYDQLITAPLNGFTGADDYYARCSSRPFVSGIARPTLILHAKDDPFMHVDDIPTPDELSPVVRLLALEHGGHVGFLEGGPLWRPQSLLDRLLPAFFHEQLTPGSPKDTDRN